MKTKVLALAALLFAASSTACFAANDQKSENKQATECNKKGNKECCKAMNPFEGLNLTADQQAKLDALRQNCPAKADKNNMENKDNKGVNKNEIMAKRLECKRNYLAKVKEILTPEQYVTFLENSFVKTRMHKQHDMKAMKHGQKKGMKDGKKANKDNKNRNH